MSDPDKIRFFNQITSREISACRPVESKNRKVHLLHLLNKFSWLHLHKAKRKMLLMDERFSHNSSFKDEHRSSFHLEVGLG